MKRGGAGAVLKVWARRFMSLVSKKEILGNNFPGVVQRSLF
jgi:hypothetical protein